ncbi:MAG TPA: bifunctional 5,10-methylenetetrahydrofolate dehydrogenase/5,10-methenyltetrahydrofolate cyclohydrolase [Candidatus Paceibacterota bacterium]|nr:bifunctional 5,10-methylenetetrahydrofolate dehydrogenase/5,10-methenyltetrahydrofolate cyclohydrolase [Candidatus Paceibacterota bacterium]
MIVDGRKLAASILADVKEKVGTLGRVPTVRALTVAPSPATRSYLKIKAARAADAGMALEVAELPAAATTADALAALLAPGADAFIAQLPLPETIDTKAVLDAIPLGKDADVLSWRAWQRFADGRDYALLPPVAAAVEEILREYGVETAGKDAVVIGEGKLVGKPVRLWLERAGARVTVVTRATEGGAAAIKSADIIVSGAGVPGLVVPEGVRPGAVVIDAGTSESEGAIVGDADRAVAEVASVFTPVPGGVGPVAVACLFRNAAILLGAYGIPLPEPE